ncbi:MAG: hypothetical protein M0021_15960 [Clostridia bacterium]|nr:hypothetical protein [Clostridia bacterium]
MSKLIKRFGIFLLTGLLSIGLVAGAYAAKTPGGTPKVKNQKQEVGKNWEIKGGQMKPKGHQPHPKKNLKPTAEEIARDVQDRANRPHPTRGPSPQP